MTPEHEWHTTRCTVEPPNASNMKLDCGNRGSEEMEGNDEPVDAVDTDACPVASEIVAAAAAASVCDAEFADCVAGAGVNKCGDMPDTDAADCAEAPAETAVAAVGPGCASRDDDSLFGTACAGEGNDLLRWTMPKPLPPLLLEAEERVASSNGRDAAAAAATTTPLLSSVSPAVEAPLRSLPPVLDGRDDAAGAAAAADPAAAVIIPVLVLAPC